jgi:UDP-N-acetylmuramoyl-L-alanyl-D-glutamate--2,6-diaminopimelate ligase
MNTSSLHDILKPITNNPSALPSNLPNPPINGLALHSDEVQPGYAFFACTGNTYNGADFIKHAIEHGATVVFTQTDSSSISWVEKLHQDSNILFIRIPRLKNHLSSLANQFYKKPSHHLPVIGITGTNGKTSVCHLTAQALTAMHKKAAVIGTAGSGIWPNKQPQTLTTPDPITVQKQLAHFHQQGAQACIMEVSSHALQQNRVSDITYHSALFTNLSHDHLDYHHHLAAYTAAKKKLFTSLNPNSNAIFNLDDPIGETWADERAGQKTIGFTRNPHHRSTSFPLLHATWATSLKGIQMNIGGDFGQATLETPLIGDIQGYNILSTLGLLLSLNLPFDQAIKALKSCSPVHGRMEYRRNEDGPDVIIDFAHTPEAFTQVLTSLKTLHKGPITFLFGCGGNRDPYKRPVMGCIAEQYADTVILTNDNPRLEAAETIFQAILEGCKQPDQIVVIPDRATAISMAIRMTETNGLVVLAGKGHERTQIMGTITSDCSDHDIVNELLEAKN